MMLTYFKIILLLTISCFSVNSLAQDSHAYLIQYQKIRYETENIINNFDIKYQNNRNYTQQDIDILKKDLKQQLDLIKIIVTQFEADKGVTIYALEHLSNAITRAIDGLTNYYPCIATQTEPTQTNTAECVYLLLDEQWDAIAIKNYLDNIEYHIANSE